MPTPTPPPYPREVRAEAIWPARTSGQQHAKLAREWGMLGEEVRQ